MMKMLLFTVLLFTIPKIYSQGVSPTPGYQLITGNGFVQSKNYYLLTLLEEDKTVQKVLENDTTLNAIAKAKLETLSLGFKECTGKAFCFTERMKFTELEIKQIGDRLAYLCSAGNALGKLSGRLMASGAYVLFNHLSPKEVLVKAWEQDANGINFAISVYGEGKKANYPLIDSISFNVNDNRYGYLMYTTFYTVISECRNTRLFFIPSLTTALRLLEINERDNAGDYEPMASTVNKAAYDRIKSIKWNDYKYTVILVPGAGPEDPGVALSTEGLLRCRVAAVQYRAHLAPFIIVSGGNVHPYKTKYCEAIEMKNFLVKNLHIPENAIIVEPHARHTTTNMRNTARLIFRYGMPFQKPCITATSRGQSLMIATSLSERCKKELNEIPFRNGLRLSETEMEFYPLIEALHINPSEPMDP